MSDHPIHRLNDDVHQRVRLGILASLSGITRADFAHLKRELGLTDGNLGRHLESLQNAGLISTRRPNTGGRSRTWVQITAAGRAALRDEIRALKDIITTVESKPDASEPSDHPARRPPSSPRATTPSPDDSPLR